ncbi:hypothetical protein GSI_08620 [Ganoderma sinense ZZ0214-1]|uniref:DUF6532 domain-containing protein n=1 Tax=Ganoderma sinense ZZ0214-1 TaxID=1077348 RepID=A0A2G8S476_9APHY|nr:hypothetical protein GSI_08620 [Ganoderma sinense ZZ0214-1]
MSARSRSSAKKTGVPSGTPVLPVASPTATTNKRRGRGKSTTDSSASGIPTVPSAPTRHETTPGHRVSSTTATPITQSSMASAQPASAVAIGQAATVSSHRPQRRSKTEAMAKKVWSADAPTSRKRAISVSEVTAAAQGTATKKGKRVTQANAVADATTEGAQLAKLGSVKASTQIDRHDEAVDIEMSSGNSDTPLARLGAVPKGRRPPAVHQKPRASTMGLDHRTFVADDGGLGTTGYPSDDDGEVSAVESDTENPRAAADDEQYDGARSSSDDELRSDAEAEELAKALAIEKPVWTEKNKSVKNLSMAKAAAATSTGASAGKAPLRPKRAAANANQTYRLPLDDLDNSGSSGSEFEPEENDDDELPSEEYTVDLGEEVMDEEEDNQVRSGATSKGKKSNKSSAIRGPKAKQLLEQPVWKDFLLSAIAKAHDSSSTGLPANLDLSAFADEVHMHFLNQVLKTSTPGSHSTISIPSHLGFVTPSHPRSTSIRAGPSASLSESPRSTSIHGGPPASVSANPPTPANNTRFESWDDDFGDDDTPDLGPQPAVTGHQPEAPNAAGAGQTQDKPANEYAIIPPTQPGGTLQLMVQEEAIRNTVRQAIADLDRYLAFENAFPDAITRSRVIADLLVSAAGLQDLNGLQERLKTDPDFTRTLSALPKQRMSTFRGAIKKLADSQVPAFCALTPGECKDKVEWLFFHLAYIYPFTYTDDKKTISWSAPNKGPIVRHLLHLAFCNGPTSIAAKNPDRFKSSMQQMPQADEKEMPMPMVALVGAAIHASLSEWRTGVHKPMAFSADAFADAYNEHITLLTGIKNKNIRGYHAMMHRLYREATGITPPTAAATAPGGTALEQVDFANMDMD